MGRTAKDRRPDRIIDMTAESVQQIPVAETSNSDIYYDRTETRFAVIRNNAGKLRYQCRITALERKAMGLGSHTPYITLGVFEDFDKAKLAFEAMKTQVENTMKAYQDNVMKGRMDVPPEDILMRRREPKTNPKYEPLMTVLMDAYARVASGKGDIRHNEDNQDFVDQDMMQIMDRVGPGFALGQAIKKIVESQRLRHSTARNELLDAISYLAGAVLWRDIQTVGIVSDGNQQVGPDGVEDSSGEGVGGEGSASGDAETESTGSR